MQPENGSLPSSLVTGDGDHQFCSRCGAVNRQIPRGLWQKCSECSWRLVMVGPLWSEELRHVGR